MVPIVRKAGKGHYYKNHNIENQKEHQKICKPSLHQKASFRLITTSKVSLFLVHHYYKNPNVKKD